MSLLYGIGEGSGTAILTNIIPYEMIDAAVRMIYRHIADHGLSPQYSWTSRHNAVPELADSEPVMEIGALVAQCVPDNVGNIQLPHQLIFQPPDDVPEDYPITEHIDVPPDGKINTLIAGIPLTDWTGRNGSPHIFRGPMHDPLLIDRGSILLMGPQCRHSPGINRDSTPRIGMYVRWTVDKSQLGEK